MSAFNVKILVVEFWFCWKFIVVVVWFICMNKCFYRKRSFDMRLIGSEASVNLNCLD